MNHEHATRRHMHSGPKHDLLANMFFAGRRRHVYRSLAALSGARTGDDILDVGCGDGYLTRLLAPVVASTGTVHGVDPSAEAIERARALGRGDICSYAEGGALPLDASDDTYDVVVSTLTMHHLHEQDRPTAVREMLRVLRPGGQLLLAEFRPPKSRLLRKVVGPVTSDAMLNNQPQLIEPLLGEAGFSDIAAGELRPWIHYLRARKPKVRLESNGDRTPSRASQRG